MEKKILYLVYNFNLVTCMHKDKRGHKKKKKTTWKIYTEIFIVTSK